MNPTSPAGLTFERHYTRDGQKAEDKFTFSTRDVELHDTSGKLIFSMKNVEVPVNWSDNATRILAQKYFRKSGVPGTGHETSLKQVVNRMVDTWVNWGQRYGYFASNDDAEAFREEVKYTLYDQRAAPNSPQWFNTGLYHAYGIEGPAQGHWYVDPETNTLTESDSAYRRGQPHACFILSVDDDLVNEGGIMDLWKNEARIFKYGSGTGTNFSSIRAKNELLSGGGQSSGLMSFLAVGDRAAGAIKSGGTTRRAAKMVVLDDDHPEILEFIRWKAAEERKAKALMQAGYDAHYEGEAYLTVSGQNSNNSVSVSNAFLQSVERGLKWRLHNRTDDSLAAEIEAKELWNELCHAAWECADPGVQFRDTMNDWNTCPAGGKIRATNPCSEYVFLDNTACNLASINLLKFYDRDLDGFDMYNYLKAVRLWTVVLDISVQMAHYPTPQVATQSWNYRTLGLGYTNLGALLMRMHLPYNSGSGRKLCSDVTAGLHFRALNTSAELAEHLGAFPGYEANAGPFREAIKMHIQSYKDITWTNRSVMREIEQLTEARTSSGFRNAQVSCIAPTGTISLLMDCDTTGIEPMFSLVSNKTLAGGGTMQIKSTTVDDVLDEILEDATEVREKINTTGSVQDCDALAPSQKSLFETANDLPWEAHVDMMAAAQPFLSGAISKTINLPQEATVQDVSDCYMYAWKKGLKAVAIYRNFCKASQPLNSVQTNEDAPGAAPATNRGQRVHLPQTRNGTTTKINFGGHTLFLRTGNYEDGQLGEIFIDMHKEGTTLRSMLNCYAIAVSIGLQYGVPLEEFVEKFTFTRFEPYGFTDHPNVRAASSIPDLIFRLLGFQYLDRRDLVQQPDNPAGILPSPTPGNLVATEIPVSPVPATDVKKKSSQ